MYKPNKEEISKLHKHTGLGVQACYKALIETQGDFAQATQMLFKKAGQLAHKRLGRTINAGKAFAAKNKENNFTVLIGLGSETDFVAQNENFQKLGTTLVEAAVQNRCTEKEALLKTTHNQQTLQEAILQLAGTTGENLSLTYYQYIQADTVGMYLHAGNRIGAIVGLSAQKVEKADLVQRAQDIAMHIAANDPLAIDEASIDPKLLAETKEAMLSTLSETQRNNPTIKEKALKGKFSKFLKENTLLEQPFLKEESKRVGEYLQSISPTLTVTQYKRFQIGN